MFNFSNYLTMCREQMGFTQSELVEKLVDLQLGFGGLDTTTFSRWERGVSKPSLSKQTAMIHYLSNYFGRIYPFIGNADKFDIEKGFCGIGFTGLIGRHKDLVMKFPTHQMNQSGFIVGKFSDSEHQKSAFDNNLHIYAELYKRQLKTEQLAAFSKNPNNLFLVCDHDGQYFGHLFLLRLKPQVFDELIHFKREDSTLTDADIAAMDEVGSYYFYGMFAMSDQIVALLAVHVYSCLIRHQKQVKEIGMIIASKDGQVMAVNMNMQRQAQQTTEQQINHSFRASLAEMLINDNVVKMLFNREACSED